MQLEIPAAHPVERTVYDFKKAGWPRLKLCLLETNWRAILAQNGNDATSKMVQRILEAVALTPGSTILVCALWRENVKLSAVQPSRSAGISARKYSWKHIIATWPRRARTSKSSCHRPADGGDLAALPCSVAALGKASHL